MLNKKIYILNKKNVVLHTRLERKIVLDTCSSVYVVDMCKPELYAYFTLVLVDRVDILYDY